MHRLLPFKTFESRQQTELNTSTGHTWFELYGEQTDHTYTLRINPSQELFDLDLGSENGGVITGNTDDIEGLADRVMHLENGAVYDWLVKCINDTFWFYSALKNI